MTNTETAQRFVQAFTGHDVATMTSLLTEDFTFEGPMMQHDGRQDFLDSLSNCAGWKMSVEFLEALESDTQAVLLYRWSMHAPVSQSLLMSEWYELRDGKICAVRLVFDSSQFTLPTAA